MASSFWVFLILLTISPDSAQEEFDVISTDSAPVLLPCVNRFEDPMMASWQWADVSRRTKDISMVTNSNSWCTSSTRPHIAFAKADCFGARDFSLSFTPTLKDGGVYTCMVHERAGTSHITRIKLVVFRAIVTPSTPLPPGGSLSFSLDVSGLLDSSSIVWDPRMARGTVKGVEFQWKHNGVPIMRDGRHSLAAGNLNVSCFQEEDIGEYTLTGRLKNGMTASDSCRVAIAESSSHYPIIVCVILAIIGVVSLITTVILIYRRRTPILQGQPGTYVNVPLPGGHSNQDSPMTDSTYMSLNLKEQSLYSQLHR
ncbi:uncharacterized protein LOC119974549 isoform X2 [Scyliorhinus canicula]|uniref:uncharacterized protein LOC119974549 isoform X2 n=1 Tax=Scyliorhinus canicula TaxID=7830 RepID=UPI0018F31CE1|nr:uncharacterized protein LOC119974549 isoform X2 [Scyliorhinus canicula]